MKVLLVTLILVALIAAQSPELEKCLKDKCPTEYNKCLATKGCEDKLKKCADKCGEKLNQTCWTLCLGLPGAAANVALCAVNKGCISNVSKWDRMGLTLMQAISLRQKKNIVQ